jgi:hypothetical protein
MMIAAIVCWALTGILALGVYGLLWIHQMWWSGVVLFAAVLTFAMGCTFCYSARED